MYSLLYTKNIFLSVKCTLLRIVFKVIQDM